MGSETILSLISARARGYPDAPAIYYGAPGSWQPMSLREMLGRSRRARDAFVRLGLKRGDRVAILCRTRVEWLLTELAAMMGGMVVVGIDAHASNAQIALILEDSNATAVVIDSAAALARLPSRVRERLSLIIAIDRAAAGDPDVVPQLRFWDQLFDSRPGDHRSDATDPAGDRAAVDATNTESASTTAESTSASPTTLLYTSGTTGSPKGIVYRQRQLAAACRAILDEFGGLSDPGGSTVCWLPMAALFQRMMNYVALSSGVTIYFVGDPTAVVRVAKDVQPTYFIGVPRFFEKFYQQIQQELLGKRPWVRKLVDFALANSPRVAGLRNRSGSIRQRILDALVLKRLRGVLGSRVRFMISGSAPAPSWMLDFLDRLGILVLEAYGVSENTVPISANRPDAYRFGSAGKVFAVNEVRIDDDGEILVRGPGLFEGYVGQPAVDRLTADGFYRTGDLGRIDDDGFLFVSGRKSDVFKTSTGRWIAPNKIEAAYKRIPYVEQIIVVGRGRQHPAALLVVNERLLDSVLDARGIKASGSAPAPGVASQPAAQSQIKADIEAAGTELAPYERIVRFSLLASPLTMEGGELTPSLKVKRDVVEQKYRELIDRLYVDAT